MPIEGAFMRQRRKMEGHTKGMIGGLGLSGLILGFLLNAHAEHERVERAILERLASIEAQQKFYHGHSDEAAALGALAAARTAARVAESGVAAAATPPAPPPSLRRAPR